MTTKQATVKQYNSNGKQDLPQVDALPAHIQAKILNGESGYFSTPAMWYNPTNMCIHEDSHLMHTPDFSNDSIVMDLGESKRRREQYKQGNYTDLKGVALAGISDSLYDKLDAYVDVRSEFASGDKSALDRHIRQGGILRREDYLYMRTLQAETQLVLGLPPEHVLLQAVTVIPTTSIDTIKYYKLDGSQPDYIHEDISDLEVPDTGSIAFTSDTAALKLYGAHTASTWEFRNQTYDVNVADVNLRMYGGQMDRKRNEQVANTLHAVSGTAQGLWDAVTGTPPVNSRNPRTDIETLSDLINNSYLGTASTIISNRKVWRTYAYSTWNTGYGTYTQQNATYSPAVNTTIGNVQGFPGFKWIIDTLVTATEYNVIDPAGIRFYDGPERTISYANTQTEIEGTIFKSYFGIKAVETSILTRGTGVTGS